MNNNRQVQSRTRNTNRGRRRRNQRRNVRNYNNDFSAGPSSQYRLNTSPGNQLAMPMSIEVDLPWSDVITSFVPTGSSFGAFRYRGNSPFDPDPLLGGVPALYYPQWANFYRRFRVMHVVLEATFVNLETFPVNVTYAPTDFDFVASISSNQRAADLGNMPYGNRSTMLGPVGSQNRSTLRRVVPWAKFTGNKTAYYADNEFAALNNANPVSQTDLTFAIYAMSPFVNGIGRNVKIVYHVLWTDINSDFSSLRTPQVEAAQAKRFAIEFAKK